MSRCGLQLFLLIHFIHQMTASVAPVDEELKYRIEEEVPSGTFIGDVVRDANLASAYDASVLHRLQFRFLKQHGLTSGNDGGFIVDSSTGVIRTQGRIDREVICSSGGSCDIRADVAVQPVEYFRIIRITISILDINDNWPIFSDPERIIEVLESALVGTVLFLPEATDLDGRTFSVQAYKLFSDSDRFALTDPDRKPDGSFDTKLIITKSLDRETSDRFNVQIVALDGGFPPKTSSVALTIYVLDVNDNIPEFDQAVYEATVDESVPIGTSIIQVRAQDKDLGLNGAVLYALDLQTSSQFGEIFSIDNATGEISTRGSIDYEHNPSYRLVVTARDKGMDSKPASAVVTIGIEDMNDNSPQITVDTLSTEVGVAEIREDVPLGTFVGHVTVEDKDSGKNGQFRCAINDPNFQLLPVYETEFRIVTAMILDREVKDEYNVTLSCRDMGSEPLTTSKSVRIRIGDVNDNVPIFQQDSYRGDLIENNYVGASIVTVMATDKDVGANGDVTYSLAGDSAQSFHIDPNSGLVTAAVRFDREQNEVIRFHVVATDKGAEPKSSSAQVVFTVFDVNDEHPIFSQQAYSFAVGENLREGSEVGAVAARDADSAIYGEVTYSIIQSSAHASLFHMDRKTGVITTTAVLDREDEYSYQLTAVATDRGVPPKSSAVNVTIYVSDDNDHSPMFDFPSGSNNTVQVSTRAAVGHIITRLKAHDQDTGRNAKIVYTMITAKATSDKMSTNDSAGYFDLDSEWGTLMVGRDLSELHGRRFLLDFMAKDQGTEVRSSDIVQLIVIVNQSAPLYIGGRRPGDASHQSGPHWLNSITQNLLIVIAIAVGSGIVIVILIIAIVMLRRQDGGKSNSQKYNCRAEAIKMLSKDGTNPAIRACGGDGGDYSPVGDSERYAAYGSVKGVCLSPDSTMDVKLGFDQSLASDTSCHQQSLPDHSVSMLNNTATNYSSNGNLNSTLNRRLPCSTDGATSSRCYSPKPQNKELEVERLLRALQRDNDEESEHSGEGSNTDSGRGISEEGEAGIQHHMQQHSRQQLQQQNSTSVPTALSNQSSKPINVVPHSFGDAKNNGNIDTVAPLVPHRTYHRYDTGQFNPPPILAPHVAYSTSNNLSLVDSSRKTPQHHVNSFGSTGVLQRGNIDSNNPYTEEPCTDALLQNALNDGFLMNGHLSGTSPRSGCHRAAISPRSATLPQRAGIPPGSCVPDQANKYDMAPAVARNLDPRTPEYYHNRHTNNLNGPHYSQHRVLNNCRSPAGMLPVTSASPGSCWEKTPGTIQESDYGTPYSCGDISDVLSAENALNSLNYTPDNRRLPPYLVDGNTGTTSVISCVPDPNELCKEIDELFFSNMRTSNL